MRKIIFIFVCIFLFSLNIFADDKIINVYDLLEISVENADYLSSKVLVDEKGTIDLTMIGVLDVKGVELLQFVKDLKGYYTEFIDDPSVVVKKINLQDNQIMILGVAKETGVFEYKEDMTFQLLLKGIRGVDTELFDGTVKIIRKTSKGVDVQEITNDYNNIKIYPRDIIKFEEKQTGKVYVTGEISRPGTYALESADYTLLDIIQDAGGFLDYAGPSKVRVMRLVDGSRDVFFVNAKNMLDDNSSEEFILKDGDIIYVPRNIFAKVFKPIISLFHRD